MEARASSRQLLLTPADVMSHAPVVFTIEAGIDPLIIPAAEEGEGG